MTLKRKIEKEDDHPDLSIHSEMILKGGHVAADNIQNKDKLEWTDICLRISKQMVSEIDDLKIPGSSRNAWIREAIIQRFEKDKKNDH